MAVNEKNRSPCYGLLTFDTVQRYFFMVFWACMLLVGHACFAESMAVADSASVFKTPETWAINAVEHHPWWNRVKTPETFPAMPRPDHNRTAPFLTALFILLVMALLRQLFPRYVDSLTSFIRPGNRTARQDNLPLQTDEKASVLFNLLYYIGLGTVLFFWLDAHTPWRRSDDLWLFWLKVCGLLCLFFILRFSLIQWVANTFSQQDIWQKYRFMLRVNHQTIALFLIPCLVLLIMTHKSPTHHYLLNFSLILIGLGWFIRALKSREWGLRLLRIDGLHFLLYLCAFEIVPVLVLIRLVQGIG